MNETQKGKRRLRDTKRWKALRHEKNVEQKGIDPITHGKLSRTANLHHMDLRPENYENLDDKSKFVLLNRNTHANLHWLYGYYRKDPNFLERLVGLLKRMVEINS